MAENNFDGAMSLNSAKTMIVLSNAYAEGTFEAADYSKLKTINGAAVSTGIRISGNALANSIIGGSGNDTLDGAKGNDTLTGGEDSDIFIYNGGKDIITDFNLGEDSILVEGTITKYAQSDANVIITVGSAANILTLKNIALADIVNSPLHTRDFSRELSGAL